MLSCTICGNPADLGKLRLEIAQGAATYLLCLRPVCINEAIARANDNLLRASNKARAAGIKPGVIEARSTEA